MGEINMFDGLTSTNIASYWQTRQQQEAPYLGEILFPNTKQASHTVTFYRGLTRAPQALKPSSLDANAIVRDRQGLESVTAQTHFFKESKYIDENLRQELGNLNGSNDQQRRQIILDRIFNDSVELARGAALTREIARMQLLTTGQFTLAGNGQVYHEDFGMNQDHISNPYGWWGGPNSDPQSDFTKAIDTIGNESGATITRAVMNRKTFQSLIRDNNIKSTLLANNANTGAITIPRQVMLGYLQDEFGITVQVYDKGYSDANGKFTKFIPDGKVAFLPAETLGQTVFSPTPEETDLVVKPDADVSFVDTGVAIATATKFDPVTRETKVSQRFLPTFEQIDNVYILDAFNGRPGTDGGDAGNTEPETPPEG